jgi:hypothetical protein
MDQSNPVPWRRRALSFLIERSGLRAQLEERWRRDIARSVAEGRKGTAATSPVLDANERGPWEQAADTQIAECITHLAASRQALAVLRQRIDALEGAMSLARRHDIRASVASAVAEAPLILDPVPHLIAEPLLPADVYDLLVRSLLEPSAFGAEHSGNPSVGLEGLDTISPPTRMVCDFADSEIARTIAETAIPRLRPYLHRRYAELFGADKADAVAASPHSSRGGRLTPHRRGHVDRPHVPPKDSAVTVILALAPPGGAAPMCLALHAIDGCFAPVRIGVSYPEDHGCTCRPIARLPLRTNAAVLLTNTGTAQSIESRPPLEAKEAVGYTFSCQLGPDRSVLVDVAASLPPAAQQGWLGLLTEPLR